MPCYYSGINAEMLLACNYSHIMLSIIDSSLVTSNALIQLVGFGFDGIVEYIQKHITVGTED